MAAFLVDDDETFLSVARAVALVVESPDATEEAIYNALCGAETMVGRDGRTVQALPIDRLQRLIEKYPE